MNVSTVGCGVDGVVVLGSHAAIWSASELASGTNEMTDALGTSLATALLSVTAVGDTLSTVVPVAIPFPNTDMPVAMPLVAPKVKVVPAGVSSVVDWAMGTRSDRSVAIVRNVIGAPSGTSSETGPFSVTVVALSTLCTIVPAGIFGPKTAMSRSMPAVDANVSTLPEGQSADVFTLMGKVV